MEKWRNMGIGKYHWRLKLTKNERMGETIGDQSIFALFFLIKNERIGEKIEKNTIIIRNGLRDGLTTSSKKRVDVKARNNIK